jgi:hypothetical protein
MNEPEDTGKAEGPWTRTDSAGYKRHIGEAHWTVRWARACELLDDGYGTGDLLGELKKLSHRTSELHGSWREALPVALWMYLQLPDKWHAHRQFRQQYRPSERPRRRHQPGWKAVKAANVTDDPDLAMVIRAWPILPEAIRAGIAAMVRAAGG